MKVITLPTGRNITVTEYARSWKRLLNLPPQREVAYWEWYPMTAAEILQRISASVHDRINRRGGLRQQWREFKAEHAHRKLTELHRRGLVACECRWCGANLPVYQPKHSRFCDVYCQRTYNS